MGEKDGGAGAKDSASSMRSASGNSQRSRGSNNRRHGGGFSPNMSHEYSVKTLDFKGRVIPFKYLPSRIVIELLAYVVFWLNVFPPKDGLFRNIGPRALVTGLEVDYNKHCRLLFGAYVQVHEDNTHTNDMTERTTGAIALRPTGNTQGSYYFFSLTTGRRLNRRTWTVLPMPQDVIDRVNHLGEHSGAAPGITFLTDPDTPLTDSDSDSVATNDTAPAGSTGVTQDASNANAVPTTNFFAPLADADDGVEDDVEVKQEDLNENRSATGEDDGSVGTTEENRSATSEDAGSVASLEPATGKDETVALDDPSENI